MHHRRHRCRPYASLQRPQHRVPQVQRLTHVCLLLLVHLLHGRRLHRLVVSVAKEVSEGVIDATMITVDATITAVVEHAVALGRLILAVGILCFGRSVEGLRTGNRCVVWGADCGLGVLVRMKMSWGLGFWPLGGGVA